MTTINPTEAFNKGIKEYLKIDVYEEIMKNISSINLSDPVASTDFRKTFNGYYKIRRDKDWQDKYYKLFEEAKSIADITFDYILYTLYISSGRVEKSFVSKMLATLNPDKPIFDSRVVNYLNFRGGDIGFPSRVMDSAYSYYDKKVSEADKKKLNPAIREYEELVLWYEGYVGTTEADEVIEAFDTAFPEYKNSNHLTRIRKIDWYIWLLGEV